jgi:Dullard-like phosphatase family protein
MATANRSVRVALSAVSRRSWKRPLSESWLPGASHRSIVINRNGQSIPLHVSDLKAPVVPTGTSSITSSSTLPQNSSSDLTVLLDLDECLIHAKTFRSLAEAKIFEQQLRLQRRHGLNLCDFLRVPFYANADYPDYLVVLVRPGLSWFLQHVCARYQVHLFTAAAPNYAQAIMAAVSDMAPLHQSQRRHYFRESCRYAPQFNAHVKDLSSHNLRRTVLVDNNPFSFLAQPENGILVHSFFGCHEDVSLQAVASFLDSLAPPDVDVRNVLVKKFELPATLEKYVRNYQPPLSAPSLVRAALPLPPPPQLLRQQWKWL